MTCPDYGNERTRIIDTGSSTDGTVIRRRRKCHRCSPRGTTFERPEWVPLQAKNRDGLIESFSRTKLRTRVERAIEKRNVSETPETYLVDDSRSLHDGDTRLGSPFPIGELVSERVRDIGTSSTSDLSQAALNSLNPTRTVANLRQSSVLKPTGSDQR
ncbi:MULTISPECIES: hypothetical protein [unclassified Natrinema]|uniref:NrdR family transcriptional regulator n=1 Tax=unclassified Natrinema TaxID=2622230 RepID=UPI00026D4B8A|nr:transcriptional regulator NrdR [Natrinema sp. J7-2]